MIALAVTLLWCVTLAQGVLLLLLYRQVGMTLLRRAEAIGRDGPSVRARLPQDAIRALTGSQGLASLAGFTDALVVFARPTCLACSSLWPDLSDFMASRRDIAVFVVIGADETVTARYASDHGLVCSVIPDPGEQLFGSCRVRVSPFAIVTNAEFVVRRKGLVNHREHLENIVQFERDDALGRSERSKVGRGDGLELAR